MEMISKVFQSDSNLSLKRSSWSAVISPERGFLANADRISVYATMLVATNSELAAASRAIKASNSSAYSLISADVSK